LQRGCDPARGGTDDVVDLTGVGLQPVQLTERTLGVIELSLGELAVGTAHARDRHAVADRRLLGGLWDDIGQVDRLIHIAGRIRIRDVVAGHRDGALKRLQRRSRDSE
jgi:hypothetical protein